MTASNGDDWSFLFLLLLVSTPLTLQLAVDRGGFFFLSIYSMIDGGAMFWLCTGILDSTKVNQGVRF